MAQPRQHGRGGHSDSPSSLHCISPSLCSLGDARQQRRQANRKAMLYALNFERNRSQNHLPGCGASDPNFADLAARASSAAMRASTALSAGSAKSEGLQPAASNHCAPASKSASADGTASGRPPLDLQMAQEFICTSPNVHLSLRKSSSADGMASSRPPLDLQRIEHHGQQFISQRHLGPPRSWRLLTARPPAGRHWTCKKCLTVNSRHCCESGSCIRDQLTHFDQLCTHRFLVWWQATSRQSG